ncbi:MAG: hypothetical protein ACI4D8_06290, partial [Wujia sp.]
MSLKDKMIRRLLNIGKKHRILVYPTLALVAVISAVSNALYWGKGNHKKLVASLMVMVMLITQSLFLTSSADTPENSPEASLYEGEVETLGATPDQDEASITVHYMRVGVGGTIMGEVGSTTETIDDDNNVTIHIPTDAKKTTMLSGVIDIDTSHPEYFSYSPCYLS